MKAILFQVACLLSLSTLAANPGGITEGNNKFAFRLYQKIQGNDRDRNLVFSPLSISAALAMAYAGAKNETALQMASNLEFPQEGDFHNRFCQLLGDLRHREGDAFRLNIANGLWAQKKFHFLDDYFSLVRSAYGAEINNAGFSDDTEREKTRLEINGWVEQKTNDKIKNLLNPGDLTSMTRLVLVNAIYFYGEWAEPFRRESTRPGIFTQTDGKEIMAPYMNQHKRYNYYEDTNIQAIELPYRNNEVSMLIFLPVAKDGLAAFEESLRNNRYKDIFGSMQHADVRLSLPKFQVTCKVLLSSILSQMGMPLAFSPEGADFSGMTGMRDLYISKVIHQAFIRVDEKGTEAAAATAIIADRTMAPQMQEVKVFDANHPFLFLIRDNSTGSILFMGKIMNPEIPE